MMASISKNTVTVVFEVFGVSPLVFEKISIHIVKHENGIVLF